MGGRKLVVLGKAGGSSWDFEFMISEIRFKICGTQEKVNLTNHKIARNHFSRNVGMSGIALVYYVYSLDCT